MPIGLGEATRSKPPTLTVTEQQRGTPLYRSAARAGMSENTARKYVRAGALPREFKAPHNWRTRKDPFENVAGEINAGLDSIVASSLTCDW